MRETIVALGLAAVIMAALLHGGIYDMRVGAGVGAGPSVIYRLNRLTGTVSLCVPRGCRLVPEGMRSIAEE